MRRSSTESVENRRKSTPIGSQETSSTRELHRAYSAGENASSPRRISQPDYALSSRYLTVAKTPPPPPSPRRRSSFFTSRRGSVDRPASSSVRLGKRRDSSVHAVDLSVLNSMAISEHDIVSPVADSPVGKMPDELSAADLEEDSCLICLGRFSKKRPAILIPCVKQCNLAPVHAKCIYEWKEQKKGQNGTGSCPLCRSELGTVDYTPRDFIQASKLVMFSQRKRFILTPLPKGVGMIRCYLVATQGSWGSPSKYRMFLQATTTLKYPLGLLPTEESPQKGDVLLITAQKTSKWGASRVDMSLDVRGRDFDPKGYNYIGAVQASMSGLEHTIVMPMRNTNDKVISGMREIGAVAYTQNRIGPSSGPRRVAIALPSVEEIARGTVPLDPLCTTPLSSSGAKTVEGYPISSDTDSMATALVPSEISESDDESDDDREDEAMYVTKVHRPKSKQAHLTSILRKGKEKVLNAGFMYGNNREPYWLESIQAYSLDFHGRVTMPSNKNFQLELSSVQLHDLPTDLTFLQFGKVVAAEDTNGFAIYTLDFQWPLSPIQAMGIGITACDRKLGCA